MWISDSSLDDIKYVLNPTFTSEQIGSMDSSDKLSRAIDGTMYLPGIVGLNNIKANDYCNVILQVSFSLLLFIFFLPPQRCIFTDTNKMFHGHALAQVVSCQPLTAEAWVHSQASLCGICGGQSGIGTGFSPNTVVFPCQYRSTSTPYLLNDLSLMLCNLSNWHH